MSALLIWKPYWFLKKKLRTASTNKAALHQQSNVTVGKKGSQKWKDTVASIFIWPEITTRVLFPHVVLQQEMNPMNVKSPENLQASKVDAEIKLIHLYINGHSNGWKDTTEYDPLWSWIIIYCTLVVIGTVFVWLWPLLKDLNTFSKTIHSFLNDCKLQPQIRMHFFVRCNVRPNILNSHVRLSHNLP